MEERREPLAGRKIHAIAAVHLVVAADGERFDILLVRSMADLSFPGRP